MTKILVTGASGCVGRGVLKYLLNNTNYSLYGLVRRPIRKPL
ncbi:MAG: NAD-dependent epimerase/dehydratase family protein, partial [Candidatus Heimdallarchaeaceae archaeon]